VPESPVLPEAGTSVHSSQEALVDVVVGTEVHEERHVASEQAVAWAEKVAGLTPHQQCVVTHA
jgi:hypothetical protein